MHSITADSLGALLGAAGVTCSAPDAETDNGDYGAARLRAGAAELRYRAARITPKKAGAFVAVWRRAADGGTEPFPDDDGVSALVVGVQEGAAAGFFFIPAATLRARGISSVGGRGGKRGFRLYPPWVAPSSAQARVTQAWQLACFVPAGAGAAQALAAALSGAASAEG